MTNKLWLGLILLFIVSLVFNYTLFKTNSRLNDDISISYNNIKAFDSELNKTKKENRVFKFTVEQLNYYNDSILNKLNEVRKELKIKDKDLKQLQYLASIANKLDTIVFKDTLFINTKLEIDTIIKDDWYNLKLGLRYPNSIIVNPTFKSEKYIITKATKETIDPPKKFFLFRWFQKKHTILEVIVIEKSPYMLNEQQRFIEIIE